MLNQVDVPRYLLERGLLGPDAVVDGGLVVRDVSSRNRNYRVETREGPSYLLKQAVGVETSASVANEAAAYGHLSRDGDGVARFLPAFYGYDADHGLLVLELVRGASDLRSHHLAAGRFSTGVASGLGTALGTLHRATRGTASPAPQHAAVVLSLHRPDTTLFRDASAASLELVRIVQQAAGFPEALDRVRGKWTPEALIHADVKWDNVLVADDDDTRVKLLDWESATKGDPCWDIGSALSHYLSFWLFSIPVTGEVPPARFPELAAYPLDSMKPALNELWRSYVEALGVDGRDADERLVRSVELAGARLVQTAFEAAQLTQQLTSALVLHLQLAHNLLERPASGATTLLSLPLAR